MLCAGGRMPEVILKEAETKSEMKRAGEEKG